MKLWDLLFIAFVIFPIVTGGIWFHGNAMHLEYTQPGIAALILGFWLWKRKSAEESPLLKKISSLWSRFESRLENKTLLTLTLCTLFFTLLWFTASLARHYALHSGAADLGIFTNGIWNITQKGWPYSSLKGGISLLADHQSYILFPIAAVFSLWPKPEILLLLQSLALALGAPAVYLLLKQRKIHLSGFYALTLFIYWSYPPIRSANLFDFHPEAIFIALILFGAWGIQEKFWDRRILGIFLFILAMLCKESSAPVGVGFCLAWILGAGPSETKTFTRYFGLAAGAACLFLFYYNTKIFPRAYGFEYGYANAYAPFGSSIDSLLVAPFQYPKEFFTRLFALSHWKFFFWCLFPLAFLPLYAPAAFMAAVPSFMMLFLSQNEQHVAFGFHYGIESAAALFFAYTVAVGSEKMQILLPRFLKVIPWVILITFGRSEIFQIRHHQANAHEAWMRKEVFPQINTKLKIAASSAIVPHVSTRDWVQLLPVLITDENTLVDCVIWDRTVNNYPMQNLDISNLTENLPEHFTKEYECRSLTIYRKKEVNDQCLLKAPICQN